MRGRLGENLQGVRDLGRKQTGSVLCGMTVKPESS